MYLIILPAELSFPSSQRVCLDLRGVEKSIHVVLTLVHGSGNLSLYSKVVRNNWIFECSRFQVPKPAGSEEVGTVQLRISNGQYFSAREEKQVLIRKAGTGTFIQMEKPVYNPGQTVKFRIVTLTEDFVPVNNKVNLQLQDPHQNRIGQWLDVRPKHGMADLSFPLASEVFVGTYTINVANPKVSGTFQVEEHVLKKFDVFFKGPARIYASDKTFLLSVCGRYSYGKAVKGTVWMSLCQKAKGCPQDVSKDICREYSGLIKLQDHYGNSMKNRKVNLIVKFMRRQLIKTYITDSSGRASFNLDTTAWNTSSVSLEGRFTLENVTQKPWKTSINYINAYHHLQPFHVTTKSFLKIRPLTGKLPCGLKQSVQVTFTLSRADVGEDTNRIDFAYYVKVDFPAKESHTGSIVQLQLEAAPGSMCAVQAVDENALLMRPENELTSQKDMGLKVFSNLAIKKPTQCTQQAERKPTMGVPSMEDQRITKEQPQFTTQGRFQSSLPETWIWDLFFVGSNGSRSIPVMTPDAVTKWKVKMFCLSGRTFGLAPTTSLRTVQPVFVDVTLPYSVIRGETFMLKATVFNYLQQCLQIHVALDKLLDFQVEDCQTCRNRECLCVEESKTFTWNVTAIQLGTLNITIRTEVLDTTPRCGGRKPLPATMRRRHALIKQLLVRPEGVLVEKSYSSLLCPRGGNVAEEPMLIHLPDNVVKGSASASVSISSDLMGLPLQNLDRLVQMPHGCGEQNMVLFTPIVYVLQYLEKTRQLTPVIKERATGFLHKGYQTQLLYRHRDGSYSVFGQQDGEGNTWLTAFVAKSFGQAKKYIYIDDKNIQDALRWLEQNQLPSGCFATKGNLFHSSLKGSLDDEISLGAYVAAALLELGQPLKGKLMQTIFHCLQHAVHNITNTYTEAVLAYAFALAGDYEITQELLYKLEEQAIKSGGQIHWSPKTSSPASTDFWHSTQSVDIELTAYVLLAYLSRPQLNARDMKTAAGIVVWLTQQQNAYGGFASTQDTVVALQALAKYAARMFSTSGQALVKVKSQRDFGKTFQVTRQKRLLVQHAELTEIPGQFLVQVQGRSCVFAQTVLRYYEPTPQTSITFSLHVNTELANCSQDNMHVLTVHILASYTGSRGTSNMVIMEVSLLSGFVLAPGSRMLMERKTIIKKVEVKADVIYIYLDKLNDESQTLILQLEQIIKMKNLKPTIIKIYDYYQPEEQALAMYSAVCS
ncbi:alpha-2-macroglobulin-like protein 1 [Lagopus leucura]|uniref:alpha-2-macroglobulin-like protein 1 n=1 Tax=Lagopus leucura TaxID=30410 RepID=UPI001C672A7D|nr:alpha-2-macroglobulin-like protein 1 [Lagopus leucura]